LDAQARANGQVATNKLKILPSVVELLNRNTLRSSIVDPDINILEAVRFFLEPADTDAALPNYQIQRELFAILGRLNMTKEALMSSGIGKVIIFYTKSSQPQPAIKRQAERLLGEWSRIVLGKRKDMRSKTIPWHLVSDLRQVSLTARLLQRKGASVLSKSQSSATVRVFRVVLALTQLHQSTTSAMSCSRTTVGWVAVESLHLGKLRQGPPGSAKSA
jgi:hypothetical protein